MDSLMLHASIFWVDLFQLPNPDTYRIG